MKQWSTLLVLLLFALSSFSAEHPAPSVKSSDATKKRTAASKKRAMAFPVAGNKSRIRDRWGASRDGGSRRHKGIDIHARKGTPVVAISDGVIVERDHTPIGGKTLWLRSQGNGITAYYAHLDRQYVSEGQYVRKGQVIGTVGNTGNARTTPSHLHFGIARGNGWVNPLPYVKNGTKVSAKTTTKKKAVKTSRKKRR